MNVSLVYFCNNCIEAETKRELYAPYNPQHNCATERKNGTIVEAAKAMIHDKSIQTFLREEACRTAIYIQNRSPHQILDNMTPKEAFLGTNPNVRHLKVFGCPVYIHIPKDKRIKLQPSSKKASLLVIVNHQKAYRIYIRGQKQIEINRDVPFEEDVACKRSKKSNMEIDREDFEPSQDMDMAVPDFPFEIQRKITELEDFADTADLIDTYAGPSNASANMKRPFQAGIMQEAEKYTASHVTFKENKRPHKFVGYIALTSHITACFPALKRL